MGVVSMSCPKDVCVIEGTRKKRVATSVTVRGREVCDQQLQVPCCFVILLTSIGISVSFSGSCKSFF